MKTYLVQIQWTQPPLTRPRHETDIVELVMAVEMMNIYHQIHYYTIVTIKIFIDARTSTKCYKFVISQHVCHARGVKKELFSNVATRYEVVERYHAH